MYSVDVLKLQLVPSGLTFDDLLPGCWSVLERWVPCDSVGLSLREVLPQLDFMQ